MKSAAGHFALKRLINQDKGRLQSENKGKSVVCWRLTDSCLKVYSLSS